jgi:DNA polymerase
MTERVLFIDLETRSAVDLKAQGVHVYARDASTGVWCACYAFSDDRRVRTWMPGQPVPTEIVEHVRAGLTVSAHNFGFEFALWTHVLTPRHGWPALRAEQGHCTAAEAAAMALPRSLDGCATALRLGVKKDPGGYQEMLRLCRPRRTLDDGTHVWWDEPDRLARLVAYCANDVEMEMMLYDRLLRLSAGEHRVWALDMTINERGVLVDLDLVEKAGGLAEQAQSRANARLYKLTGKAVEKFTQNARLLSWLQKQGVDADSLDKAAMRHLLKGVKGELRDDVREILTLRQEAAKASTAKLAAMQAWACPDGRVRGMLMYHGATTGRWCIAEGTPVLVRQPDGAVLKKPIETVADEDEVWDGHEWVRHEGVVFSGEKEVISHDGLCATPEHVVYVADDRSMTLGEAAEVGLPLFRRPPA